MTRPQPAAEQSEVAGTPDHLPPYTAGYTGLKSFLFWAFKRLTVWLTACYGVIFLATWLALKLVGERNITTAFLLYLPPFAWLLGLLPLLLLGLVFHWRCLAIQLSMGVLICWGWLGYGIVQGTDRHQSGSSAEVLSIMTYNRGQHMNQSLQPFKNATQPDLLVFQDAAGRAEGFLRSTDYAEFGHAVSVGEFTLLSRFPISENSLLPTHGPSKGARSARFVIDWNGRPVSIYAVHLMTPRDVLSSYMRGAFLWGIIGVPGTRWAEKRRHYQSFWDGQMADVEAILTAVGGDSNPCIVAGDFNAPHTGYIHGMMTNELRDAHAEAGQGFGFTFPGVTRNPLSLGGPWMRIDYIFHDSQWEALECITEKERPSQHRAVMAKLRFIRSSNPL